MTDDIVCALCGKPVVPGLAEIEVREGETPFHLECFLRYKRQASPPEPPRSD